MRWNFIAIILVLNLVACEGGSSFLGGQQDTAAVNSSQPESSNVISQPFPVEQVDIVTEEVLPMTELADLAADEKTALGECLSAWPDHPFTADQALRPTVYRISKNIENSQSVFTDNDVSAAPHLKLIVLNVRIGNQGQIDLLDRNAWSCLYFKSKVINGFGINQICDSRLSIVSLEAQNANNFHINEVCPAP